ELLGRNSLSAEGQTRAIAALGRFGEPAAVPSLLGALKAPQPDVRSAAIDALVAIVEAEGSKGRGHRQRQGERNNPPHPRTRQDHVARAVRSLLNDADALVRHRAMAAVATLKDREAIPALLAAAEAPDSRFEAANALAAVPDIRALHVYLRGLADRNTDLRRA